MPCKYKFFRHQLNEPGFLLTSIYWVHSGKEVLQVPGKDINSLLLFHWFPNDEVPGHPPGLTAYTFRHMTDIHPCQVYLSISLKRNYSEIDNSSLLYLPNRFASLYEYYSISITKIL